MIRLIGQCWDSLTEENNLCRVVGFHKRLKPHDTFVGGAFQTSEVTQEQKGIMHKNPIFKIMLNPFWM